MNIEDILIVIITLLVILMSGFIIISSQIDMQESTNEYCDNKYGEGNWEFVEKEREGFKENMYPGVIWECVEKGVRK